MSKTDIFAKAGRRYVEKSGIWIRSLTELERINLRGAWRKRVSELPKDDNDAVAKHMEQVDAEIIVCSVVDGEGGDLVFSPSDTAEVIERFDGVVFEELASAAFDLSFSGENRKAAEAAEKKSDAPADSN